MQWTKEKPTTSGYYWVKDKGEITIALITINDNPNDSTVLFMGEDREWPDTFKGDAEFKNAEWMGPIQPPK